ncbi:enoyl-CoA hydratase-related protein [Allopusillimonas ginsengisoli]|uniref:enoyl-CoA hydratase-related protein n=1 Tax=Allopusillimonas ginsengisoli TaxID=453575 RepID=UPI00101F9D03|nr:enoyl-CoA hydratase-related protein [Allopusillimonas ginsengisoli]TEA77903.1 enoyl-CoA hydratase [Allopusillimonas ginsengisoli]
MPDVTDNLLCHIGDSGVALVQLNRPDARNALNLPLRRLLSETFTTLRADDRVRCVVIAGKGPCFAAGADLREMAGLGPSSVWAMDVLSYWHTISDFPKPLIAAVHGAALGGGCELAMHADIIVAEDSARFGQPEVAVGIMPGGGATQRLMRAIGKFRAMQMLLTGEAISAQRAYEVGLASELTPDGKALERAMQIADTIARRPAIAVRLTKEVALAGADAPLATGLMLERRAFETLFDTQDQKEGMRAFLERRAANFKGA